MQNDVADQRFQFASRSRKDASISRKDDLVGVAREVAVKVGVAVMIMAIAYLLWQGTHVLLQAFAGVLFAIFLAELSERLSKTTGISYLWSLVLTVIAFLAIMGGIGWLLASHLATQIAELTEKLPQSFQRIQEYLSQYPSGRLLLEKMPQATADSLSQVDPFSRVTGLVSWMSGFLMSAVVILFVGIFGAAEPGIYKAGLMHLIPIQYRPRIEQALDAVGVNLRWWIVGQVVLMILVWVTTTIGLWLLGIPLALTLGLIAGILELIPYVGPWISAIPAVLIALLVGPWEMVLTLGLYLILHILEGYLFLPLVQREAVHLPPALALVAQVLLGELLGILGLFAAAPLTVAVVVFLKMLYVEDTLGDESVEVAGEDEASAEANANAVHDGNNASR